jgi:hypothetical protein
MPTNNEGLTKSNEDRIGDLEKRVVELQAALDYAVYGIGTAHPDPREVSVQGHIAAAE